MKTNVNSETKRNQPFNLEEVTQLYIELISKDTDMQRIYNAWRRLNFILLLAWRHKKISVQQGNTVKSKVLENCMDKVADAILICGNNI